MRDIFDEGRIGRLTAFRAGVALTGEEAEFDTVNGDTRDGVIVGSLATKPGGARTAAADTEFGVPVTVVKFFPRFGPRLFFRRLPLSVVDLSLSSVPFGCLFPGTSINEPAIDEQEDTSSDSCGSEESVEYGRCFESPS